MSEGESKATRSVQEALTKMFEDSSDSEQECASHEEELFMRGIDPAVDNLEEEDDEGEDRRSPKPSPAQSQPRKKRKSCAEVEDADELAESSFPGRPSSSAPPPPQSSRTRRKSAPLAPTSRPVRSTKGSKATRTRRTGCGSATPPSPTLAPPAQTPAAQRAEEEAEESVKWREMSDQDTQPAPHDFLPCHPSGPTIGRTASWTPFQLFKLFFNVTVVRTLTMNTNKMAQKMKAAGRKFSWRPITEEEFYTFLATIIFFGLVRCPTIEAYWRKQQPYNFHFPASAMSRSRFNCILWCLHLSDPDEDEENEQKKGSPQHDRLFKVKPLYDDILLACKAFYNPGQQLSIDERMLATEARLGFKQYLPLKPTKWGIKMFVLADMHGYTWNYFISGGKTAEQVTDGLGYTAVMRLLDLSLLGTGYQVYMDDFFTSPKLLADLDRKRIMACGAVRESRQGFPAVRPNKLSRKAKRGELRWLRVDRLLFVQWMDTEPVTVASNFHQAFGGFTASRRVRDESGAVRRTDVPIPDSVKDYSTVMGAVDLSDGLVGYSSVLHKTMKWYKKVFYHMVDIAVTNSSIIYKMLAVKRGETPVTQKRFRELLIKEMTTRKPSATRRRAAAATCAPVYPSNDATKGRRHCVACKNKTPVICRKCLTPLCFVPKRNCYTAWHDRNHKKNENTDACRVRITQLTSTSS